MKTLLNILRSGIIYLYLLGLGGSIFYSILNPRDTYDFFKTGSGDIYGVISGLFLISAWILIGITIIGMISSRRKENRKGGD